jgi:hypothetical protein
MPRKAAGTSSLHIHFRSNREMTEITCKFDKFFEKQILTVSRLQLVGLKAGPANCITPSSPEFTAPVGVLHPGLLRKPRYAKRLSAIRCGGTLNFIQDLLLIHELPTILALRVFKVTVWKIPEPSPACGIIGPQYGKFDMTEAERTDLLRRYSEGQVSAIELRRALGGITFGDVLV